MVRGREGGRERGGREGGGSEGGREGGGGGGGGGSISSCTPVIQALNYNVHVHVLPSPLSSY